MSATFVHLHLHTEYSLANGIVRVKALAKAAARAGMPAVAVTDQCNLFAMVKFYKAAMAAGVKPIIGVDLWLNNEQDPNHPSRLVLLCQNDTGYYNLTDLISRTYLEGQHRGLPMVERDWLQGHTDGLIALSGGREGEIGQYLLNDKPDEARQCLAFWKGLFPDRFYLELQRTGREGEEAYIHSAVDLAIEQDLPVVATNDVHFIKADDFEAHEARVCIHDGRTLDDPRRPRRFSDQQYLRTPEEMAELFADLPEALENTVEIAKRCNLHLTLGKNVLPEYPVPEGMSVEAFLASESRKGLEARLAATFDTGAPEFAEQRRPYDERLALELDVINSMGFPGYFLIVADFIRWAKQNGIPVGPGRGSGAGSLVAYALTITDLDPLKYDLLFERFLNPERVSMPDFDVDFCMENRDRVIEYVAERYGREKVSQIITYGTMAAKAVVRDVGRVLGHPYGFVDRIAKLIPFEIGMTLDKALKQEEALQQLYDEDEEVRGIIDLAKTLEGVARNAGKHAGGVVIAPSKLTDFTPLFCEQGGGSVVTQFDKDDVEAVGLVKFDFLGLRTLTIINWAVHEVNKQRAQKGETPIDIEQIAMEDEASYTLLKDCQTTAVFQLESRGMKDLIKRLQPDDFEDIVALVALFRPGPLQSGMVDDFINRKHGREKVVYPHPALEPILKPTYGVILYQEQVMQIAQVLAGYSLGAADLLRRAMGKKKPEEMAKQRSIFMEGAKANGVDEKVATHIFDLMEKFAGYGFNKCVVGSTRVMDARSGEITTVESLFKSRREFTVHALDDKWRLQQRRVEDVVWNGKKPVFELVTQLGKKIVATANHPFRTLSGWKNLEELRPGDRIAVPRALSVSQPARWPEYKLVTLAGLLSEGNTCHPTCLYFCSNDQAFADDFAAAAEQFTDTKARLYARKDGRLEVCVNTGRDARFTKGQVPWNARDNLATDLQSAPVPARSGAFEWARELGILGMKADQKSVPSAVFTLCESDIELFLGRLWCGDGFIANNTQFTPYYASSSRRLAEDVQTLLLRLGIISRIHTKQFNYRGTQRPGFTVHLLGDGSIVAFIEKILPHVVGRDGQRQSLIAYIDKVPRNLSSKDTIPASIRTWVAEERLKLGMTWKDLETSTGLSMKEFQGNGSAKKKGFRRHVIGRLAAFFGSQRLANVANSDVYWDTVAAIESRGIEDTYDLTVESDHNFVADGIIVHNSHSAAYALVSYQTAWLKTHYPAAFMSAVLSADMDNTDKVVTLIDECRDMKLEVEPPNINICEHRFTVKQQSVIYGLGAIKGVGASAVEALIEERKANGEYRDLFDLCQRVDLRKVNRRTLEALIMAGALDVFEQTRATLTASLPAALQIAEQYTRDIAVGQNDMFGMAPKAEAGTGTYHIMPEWDDEQRLACEKQTLGLYLTGHPIERYIDELGQFTSARIVELKPTHDQTVVVAGLIVAIRTMNTKRGDRMAFITLDDRSGRIELAVFADTYQRYRDHLIKDKLLVVEGEVSVDEYTGGYRMSARSVYDINQAREHFAKRLLVSINAQQAGNGFIGELQHTLQPFREGNCPVVIDYQRADARAEIPLGQEWRVKPTDELLHRLRELAGEAQVKMLY